MRVLLIRDMTSCWRTRRPRQPFFPRETRVRGECTEEDHVRGVRGSPEENCPAGYLQQRGLQERRRSFVSPVMFHFSWRSPKQRLYALFTILCLILDILELPLLQE